MSKFKNNKLRKFMSFTLVIAMLICSLFTMSTAAKSAVYDDEFIADLTEALASKFGVSAENIEIDISSIREATAEEVAALTYSSANEFTRNATISPMSSYNCCSNPSMWSVVVRMTITGGPIPPQYGYPNWILADVITERCQNCGQYGNAIISILQVYSGG